MTNTNTTKELKLFKLSAYGSTHTIALVKRTYYQGGGLAVNMVEYTNGYPEPYATLTVNLDTHFPLKKETAFLNTNICDGTDMLQWVIDNNIASPVGISERSGFCEYPLVEFNMDCFSNI